MTDTTPKVATQIKTAETARFRGDARLYRLSTPIDGAEHVVVSAVDDRHLDLFGFPVFETYIFPAYPNGEIADWGELTGSQKDIADPEAVLTDLGYTVVGLSDAEEVD